jgi:hypothetical protein
MEVTGTRRRRQKQLLDDLKKKRLVEIERGSIRLYCVEKSFWKRLWTFHKTDYRMNDE